MAHPDRFNRLRQSTNPEIRANRSNINPTGYTIQEDKTAKHIKEPEPESKPTKEKCVW